MPSSVLDAQANASKPASTSLAALGRIVPDRDAFRRDMLATIPAQGSFQVVTSSATIDALIPAAPGCSPPLPLLSASGLSRTQFIIAGQAASLPCVPAYNRDQGGVVLDRVLAKTGTDSWWAAVTGRLRMQKLLSQRRTKGWRKAFEDPTNYVLAANTMGRLPDGTVVRTRWAYEPHTPALPQRTSTHPAPVTQGVSQTTLASTAAAAAGGAAGSSPTAGDAGAVAGSQQGVGRQVTEWLDIISDQLQYVSGAAQLRRALGSASELKADMSASTQVLTGPLPGSPAGTPATTTLPFHASLELGTTQNHTSGFQYRLGVHHTVLPTDSTNSSGQKQPGGPGQVDTHVHASVAVQGHKVLWCGSAGQRRASNAAKRSKKGVKKQGGSGKASDSGGPPRGKVIGPHNPIRQVLQRWLRPQSGTKDKHDESLAAPSLAGRSRSASPLPEDQSPDAQSTHPTQSTTGPTTLIDSLSLPAPEEVQEAVMDVTESIKRLREDVHSLADWVSSGSFAQQIYQSLGVTPSGRKQKAPPSRKTSSSTAPPWSSLAGAPHVKIGGLMGLHVHQPLWPLDNHQGRQDHLSSAPHSPSHPRTAQQALARANSLSVDLVRAGVAWLTSAWSPRASGQSVGSVTGGFGADRDRLRAHHSARLFASLGMSAQAGWFQRSVLDFTRLTARLDLGLPGHTPGALTTLPGASAHSSWTALTLSLVQQIVGPLRLCADLRCSLQPVPELLAVSEAAAGMSKVPKGGVVQGEHQGGAPGRAAGVVQRFNQLQQAVTDQARGAGRRLRATRPQLLDSAVGLDLVVPGSSGFARVVAWYSPQRGEAMLELRLL